MPCSSNYMREFSGEQGLTDGGVDREYRGEERRRHNIVGKDPYYYGWAWETHGLSSSQKTLIGIAILVICAAGYLLSR